MNILLVAMLDKKVEDAVIKFCQLPFKEAIFNFNRYDQMSFLLETLLKAYTILFRALDFISKENL